MRIFTKSLASFAMLCGTLLTAGAAVHAREISVGQVATLSGPEGAQAHAYAAGMQLYFESINKAGGINGNTFVLVSRDDGGRPTETVNITRQILAEVQPIALAGYGGPGSLRELAASGLLDKSKTPLIGYRAADIRENTPLFYNVRASLRDELAKICEHLSVLGVTRIGLLYEEGPSGANILATTRDLAAKGGASVISNVNYEPGSSRVSGAVETFLKSQPQAIIVVATGRAGARFVEQYRTEGGAAQIFVHSGADMDRVARQIAKDRLAFVTTAMQGVAIVQVVPGPHQVARLTKEFNEAVVRSGISELPVGYVMMEGYIAAKVIIEAVKRQGKSPSSERMVTALEGLGQIDLGGYVVEYKPGNRNGARYVDLTIIGGDGKIRR